MQQTISFSDSDAYISKCVRRTNKPSLQRLMGAHRIKWGREHNPNFLRRMGPSHINCFRGHWTDVVCLRRVDFVVVCMSSRSTRSRGTARRSVTAEILLHSCMKNRMWKGMTTNIIRGHRKRHYSICHISLPIPGQFSVSTWYRFQVVIILHCMSLRVHLRWEVLQFWCDSSDYIRHTLCVQILQNNTGVRFRNDPQGHSRSLVMAPFTRPHMTSY